MARTFTFELPDPLSNEARVQALVDVGAVVGIDGASVVATGPGLTTDGLFTINDEATTGGTFKIYIPLDEVPTRIAGKVVRPNTVTFSAAKTTGSATTNKISAIGVYQHIATAASATMAMTKIGEDTTGWVTGAGAATVVDITATIDPDNLTNAVAEKGRLFVCISILMPIEAMVWVLRLGRGTVTFDNIGPS